MRHSPDPFRRALLAVLVSAALGSSAAAHAHKPYAPPSMPYLKSNLVQVDVYNRSTGLALPIYPNGNRHWIEGVPGHEYAVRIRNCTGARVLVVTSVDGVNVISGDTAAPSQTGYVLEPYGSVEIAGWRKSMSRTAAFYFTDLGDSYAARTGRPGNVGVIGVAVFQEKAVQRISGGTWDWRGRLAQRKDEADARPAPAAEADSRAANATDAQSRAASTAEAVERAERGTPADARDGAARAAAAPPPPVAQPAPAAPFASGSETDAARASADTRPGEPAPASADALARSDVQRRPPVDAAKPLAKLGTGHGRNEESRVTMTSFERATSQPAETLTLQYDRRENLIAMGVLPQPAPYLARRDPDPFPGNVRFAPDPR